MRYLSTLLLFIGICLSSPAQELIRPLGTNVPLKELQRKMDSIRVASMPAGRLAAKTTASIFDTATFAARINSCWGAGLPTDEKLKVFNTYWGQVDSFYDSFTGLPHYNWDSIINNMRIEIAGGVSNGRFAGILGTLQRLMNDGHSHIYDIDLYGTGSFFWGKPLFSNASGMYGACITMLNDSSALVYSSLPGNVLNLEPGDKVLGYNGIPWKTLVPILLSYNLPHYQFEGSTDSTTWHRCICAVLDNFQMFDIINIEKCDGTLVNIPTSVFTSAPYMQTFCTEQLQIPGIQKLSYSDYYTNNRIVTSGVIPGKGIGYVALYDCSNISGDSLLNPIKRLIEDSLVDGLIIDVRTNYGGYKGGFYRAFNYLYDGDLPWMGCGYRINHTDRYTMSSVFGPPSSMGETDDDPHFFDKKIALLIGPGAISAGDVMQVLFTHHPKLKIFGKPSAAAFGGYYPIILPYSNYNSSRQGGDFYRAEEPDFYLSHHNFPIDSAVWFDRASVCAGKDNILETAIKWIKPELSVKDIKGIEAMAKVYPNPSRGNFKLVLTTPIATKAAITMYDVTGVEIANMVAELVTGENSIMTNFDNTVLSSGTYQMMIRGNGIETIVKKVTIIE